MRNRQYFQSNNQMTQNSSGIILFQQNRNSLLSSLTPQRAYSDIDPEDLNDLNSFINQSNKEQFLNIFMDVEKSYYTENNIRREVNHHFKTIVQFNQEKYNYTVGKFVGILQYFVGKQDNKTKRMILQKLSTMYNNKQTQQILQKLYLKKLDAFFTQLKYFSLKTVNKTNQLGKIINSVVRQKNFKSRMMAFKKLLSFNYKMAKLTKIYRIISYKVVNLKSWALYVTKINSTNQKKMVLPKVTWKILKKNYYLRCKKYLNKWAKNEKKRALQITNKAFKIVIRRLKDTLRSSLYQIVSKTIVQSLEINKLIQQKIKGQILAAAQKIQPAYTKQNSYLRWKVRSNDKYILDFIGHITLHSKVNTHQFIWRCKKQLKDFNKYKLCKIKSRNLALLLIDQIQQSFALERQRKGFYKIKNFTDISPEKQQIAFSIAVRLKRLINRRKRIAVDQLIKAKLYHYRAIENMHFGDAIMGKFMKKTLIKKMALRFTYWRQHNGDLNIKSHFFQLIIKNKAQSFLKFVIRWKRLPDVRETRYKKRAMSFFDNITSLFNRRINQTWLPITTQNEDATNAKTQAIQTAIESTIQKHLKSFVILFNFTQNHKQMMKVKLTNSFIEHCQQQVLKNLTIVLENDKVQQQKMAAIEKIIQNFKHGTRNTLQLWLKKVQLKKLGTGVIRDFIKHLQTFLNNSKKQQVNNTLGKFYQNGKLKTIMKNFFTNLLHKSYGRTLKGFDKIKILPTRIEKTRGNIFEQRIVSFFNHTVKKYSLNKFNEIYVDATEQKKILIINLIYVTMGSQKKWYQKWNHQVLMYNALVKVRKTQDLFETLEKQLKVQITSSVFQSDKKAAVMSTAITKMFSNFAFNLTASFKKWRGVAQLLSIQMKFKSKIWKDVQMKLINSLKKAINDTGSIKARKTLKMFYTNYKIRALHLNFFKSLMSKGYGIVVKGFSSWRNIPVRADDEKIRKCNKFERIIFNFSEKKIRMGLDPLKNQSFIVKKFLVSQINVLIRTAGGNINSLYSKWKKFSSNQRSTQECKLISDLYHVLNQTIQNSTFKSILSKEQLIKQKAIQRIVDVNLALQRKYLKKYQEEVKIINLNNKMNAESKKLVTKMFINFFQKSLNYKLRNVLRNFNINYTSDKIIKVFFKSLMNIGGGRTSKAWDKWNQLPEQKDYEKYLLLNKFQRKLFTIYQNSMKKYSFNQNKQNLFDGESRKISIIKDMVYRAGGKKNMLFVRWKKITDEIKGVIKCKYVVDLFQQINAQILKQNEMIFGNQNDIILKEKCIEKLIKGSQSNLLNYLQKWSNQTKLDKISSQISSTQKQSYIKSLTQFEHNNRRALLFDILRKFEKNSNNKKKFTNYAMRLLGAKQRIMVKLVMTWKNLPKPKDQGLLDKLNKYERGIHSSVLRRIKLTWTAFKIISSNFKEIKIRMFLFMQSKMQTVNERNLSVVMLRFFLNQKCILNEQNEKNKQKLSFNAFQYKLTKIAHFYLQKSFTNMQDIHDKSTVTKRQMFAQMYRCTKDKRSLCMESWKKQTDERQVTTRCNRTINFTTQMISTIDSNLMFVYNRDQDIHHKTSIIKHLINNFKNIQRMKLKKWQELVRMSKLHEQMGGAEKQFFIKQLISFEVKNKMHKINTIMKQFKSNSRRHKMCYFMYRKLSFTSEGMATKAMNQMGILPERQDYESISKQNQFYTGLHRIAVRKIRIAQDPLEESNAQAISEKQRAVQWLVHKTLGGIKSYFMTMRNSAKFYKQIIKIKEFIYFFETLQNQLKIRFTVVTEDKNSAIMQKALEKIFLAQHKNIKNYTQLWNSKAKFLKLQASGLLNSQKLSMLNLNLACHKRTETQKAQILVKFHINLKIGLYKIRFFKSLLNQSCGKTIQVFDLWKGLPENLKTRQATSFESKLTHLANKNVNIFFSKFKKNYTFGKNAKKNICSVIYTVTMDKNKKMLLELQHQANAFKLMRMCKFTTLLFQHANEELIKNYIQSLQNDATNQKKENALNKLFEVTLQKYHRLFLRWVEVSKIIGISNRIDAQAKGFMIKELFKFVNFNSNHQLKNVTHKFKKNMHITKLMTSFYSNLTNNKHGFVLKTFNKWQQLPQRVNNPLLVKCNKFERGLVDVIKKSLSYATRPMKALQLEGYEGKRRGGQTIFYIAGNKQKKLFDSLRDQATLYKSLISFKALGQFLHTCNDIIIVNVSTAIGNDRSFKIKSFTIQRIIYNFNDSMISRLQLWNKKAKMLFLQSHMDSQAKKDMFQKLTTMLHSNNGRNLKGVVHKFAFNRKIILIHVKFFQSLMNQGAGKGMKTFLKWKELPALKDNGLVRKCNKFHHLLTLVGHKYLKIAQQKIKRDLSDGDDAKRRMIQSLVYKTQGANKRIFTEWKMFNRNHKQDIKCYAIVHLFENLSNTVVNSIQSIIESKEYLIKSKAVGKLIYKFEQNFQNTFKKWLSQVKIKKIQENIHKTISDNNLRKMINNLSILNKHTLAGKLRHVTQQFAHNSRLMQIQWKIFKTLLTSRGGVGFKVLSQWKFLPRRKVMGPANFFEERLTKYIQKALKKFMNRALEDHFQGVQERKNIASGIFDNFEGGLHKMFILWKDRVYKQKMLTQCSGAIHLFEHIQDKLNSNCYMLWENDNITALKEKSIRKLIHNANYILHKSLDNWKHTAKAITVQLALGNQDKKKSIKNLINYGAHTISTRLKEVLSKFGHHNKLVKIQIIFYNKLMCQGTGKGYKFFDILKTLPSKLDLEKNRRISNFQRKLSDLSHKDLRKSFNLFKENLASGVNYKKEAVKQFVKVCMSDNKRMFLNWVDFTENLNNLIKCKQTIHFFETVTTQVLTNQFSDILINDTTKLIKTNAIQRLINNNTKGLNKVLKKWINQCRIIKIQMAVNQGQRNMAQNKLKTFLKGSRYENLRNCVKKFKTNAGIEKSKQAFFQHLLNNKSGATVKIFKKWEGMPLRKNDEYITKCNKFQHKLQLFGERRIRISNNCLTANYQAGLKAKTDRVQIIVDLTFGKINRCLKEWNIFTLNIAQMKKCRITMDFFNVVNQAVVNNYIFSIKVNSQTNLMDAALTKIFNNALGGMRKALQNWKEMVILSKLDDKNKKNLIGGLQRFHDGCMKDKVRRINHKFYINMRLYKISTAFYTKLLMTGKWKSLKAWDKIKTLPLRKDGGLIHRSNVFTTNMVKFALKYQIISFNKMKTFTECGINAKRAIIKDLVNRTLAGDQKSFLLWKQRAEHLKQLIICRKTVNFLEVIQTSIHNNLSMVMANQREIQLKYKMLEILIRKQTQKLGYQLKIWNTNQKQIFLAGQIDLSKKKIMISHLHQFLNNNNVTIQRKVMKQFSKNSTIKKYQNNFFRKLMGSSYGKAVKLVQTWKNLPVLRDYDHIVKCNKFERQINCVGIKYLKISLGAMDKIRIEGTVTKERQMSSLVVKTMSDQKKFFRNWKHTCYSLGQLIKIRKTIQMMELLHLNLTNSFQFVGNNKNSEIMIKAFQKCLNSQKSKMRFYFQKYSNIVRQKHLIQAMNDKQKKSMIGLLHNTYMNNKSMKIKLLLAKFQKNRRIQKIVHSFFKGLLNKGCGRTLKVVTKWKGMPNKRDDKKLMRAMKTFSVLSKLVSNCLTKNAKQLQNMNQDGIAYKKKAISTFVWVTLGKNSKYLKKWLIDTFNHNQRLKAKIIIDFLSNVNANIQSKIYGNLCKDLNKKKKIGVIKRLISQSNLQLLQSITNWREITHVTKVQKELSNILDNKKKEGMIRQLKHILNSSSNGKLKGILKKFKTNFILTKTMFKFWTVIMSSQFGKTEKLYKKWFYLPKRVDESEVQRNQTFQMRLQKLMRCKIGKSSFSSLKEIWMNGYSEKKTIAREIIETTMSKQNKIFNTWFKFTTQYKNVRKIKLTLDFYHYLEKTFETNLKLTIFDKDELRNQDIKIKTLKKLFNKFESSIQHSYNTWKLVNSKFNQDKFDHKFKGFEEVVRKKYINHISQSFLGIKRFVESFKAKEITDLLWRQRHAKVEAGHFAKFAGMRDKLAVVHSFIMIFRRAEKVMMRQAFRKVEGRQHYIRMFKKALNNLKLYQDKKLQRNLHKWQNICHHLRQQEVLNGNKKLTTGSKFDKLVNGIFYKNIKFAVGKLKNNSQMVAQSLVFRLNQIMLQIMKGREVYALQRLRKNQSWLNKAKWGENIITKLYKRKMKNAMQTIIDYYKKKQYKVDGSAFNLYKIIQKYQQRIQSFFFRSLKNQNQKVTKMVQILQRLAGIKEKDLFIGLQIKKSNLKLQKKLKSLTIIKKYNTFLEIKLKKLHLVNWHKLRMNKDDNIWTTRVVDGLTKNPTISIQVALSRLRDYAIRKEKSQNQTNTIILGGSGDVSTTGLLLYQSKGYQTENRIKAKLFNNMLRDILFKKLESPFNMLYRLQSGHSMMFSKNSPFKQQQSMSFNILSNQISPITNISNKLLDSRAQNQVIFQNINLKDSQCQQNQEFYVKKNIKQQYTCFFEDQSNYLIFIKKIAAFSKKEQQNMQTQLKTLQKDSDLIKQVEQMRNDNKGIKKDLIKKEKDLDDAYDSISILSTRITQMITIKFVNILDRYSESLVYHGFRKFTENMYNPTFEAELSQILAATDNENNR